LKIKLHFATFYFTLPSVCTTFAEDRRHLGIENKTPLRYVLFYTSLGLHYLCTAIKHFQQHKMLATLFQKVKVHAVGALRSAWAEAHLRGYYNSSYILRGGVIDCKSVDCTELFSISFNNAKVVSYQIRSLRKFFKQAYRYTVFDNSSDDGKAAEIAEVCREGGVGYIRLPRQPFLSPEMGSYSHGIACNWVFRNFIMPHSRGKYVGLLDHDIFLVRDFFISRILDRQPFYGQVFSYDRAGINYLWPGLWLARRDFLEGKKIDFRPSIRLGGDTGVSNYRLFLVPDFDKMRFAQTQHVRLDAANGDILANGYSKIDEEWIHCWNASEYRKADTWGDKMQVIYDILDTVLASEDSQTEPSDSQTTPSDN